MAYACWVSLVVWVSCTQLLDEDGQPTIVLDVDVIALVGAALFFLVIFRANSSYGCWYEGRKCWEGIVTTCHSFVRRCITSLPGAERADLLARLTLAYAIACKQQLREDPDLSELDAFLTPLERAQLIGSKQPTLAVLDALSTELVRAQREQQIDTRTMVSLDESLTELMAILESCERILGTKMPSAHVVHLRTFLLLWLMALPLAIIPVCSWAAAPITVVLGYALFGIERMSLDVERPFGHGFSDLGEYSHQGRAVEVLEMLVRNAASDDSVFSVASRAFGMGGDREAGAPPRQAESARVSGGRAECEVPVSRQ